MHKKFVQHDLTSFINISGIVGISRRTSCILFTKMHTDALPCPPRDDQPAWQALKGEGEGRGERRATGDWEERDRLQ